jgi:lysozyme family protein
MPETVARQIYWKEYWMVLRCNDLPAGVEYAVFDYGVNSGIGRAGKVLRRVLHRDDRSATVADDVIAAARAHAPDALIDALCAERLAFLKKLRTWPVFGKGWARRVNGVRVGALALARGERVAQTPAVESGARSKGVVAPGVGVRQLGTGVIVAVGAAGALQAPNTAGIIAIVAGVVLACVALSLALSWWWRRRQEAPVRSTDAPDLRGAVARMERNHDME